MGNSSSMSSSGGLYSIAWNKPFASCETVLVQDRSAWMVLGRAGPGYPAFLQAFVAEARIAGSHCGDLVENLAGRFVAHGEAETGRNIANDLPIGPSFPDRFHCLTNPEDISFGIGECAVLFRIRSPGKDHVSQLCRVGEEYVYDGQEFCRFERVLDMIRHPDRCRPGSRPGSPSPLPIRLPGRASSPLWCSRPCRRVQPSRHPEIFSCCSRR